MQKEVYDEYLDLMYGPEPETKNSKKIESEDDIIRPHSKLNTPCAYDSSSEDSALNARIATRRTELGVFEKSQSTRKVFQSSDSDSAVYESPKRYQNLQLNQSLVKLPQHTGVHVQSRSFQENPHQALVDTLIMNYQIP